MKQSRRDFLKKSLKIGSASAAVVASVSAFGNNKQESGSKGVVSGTSKKKEVLYYKSEAWEKYYKIVY